MNLIAVTRPRCGGKTHKLAELFHVNADAVFIVLNMVLAADVAHRYGIDKKQIYTIGQVQDGALRGRTVKVVCIDDLEIMLSQLLNIQSPNAFIVSGTGSSL